MDDWKRFDKFHEGILCCAGVQINIQPFHAEFFRSLVDHCRIFRSSFIGIYALPLAFLLCYFFRLRCQRNLSRSVIMAFFMWSMCSHRSYTTVNHGAFKTYPKISNTVFFIQILISKTSNRKNIIFFCSNF